VLDGCGDALPQSTALFFGDGGEDVSHQIRDLAPFAHTVHGDPEHLEFLATPHALQNAPSQPVEPKDHDDHGLPLGTQSPHLRQERLIGRTVVPLTGKDILKLLAEHPAVLSGVATTLSQLSIQAHALPGLFFGRDSRVDESSGESAACVRFGHRVSSCE
jgi:hypothetical protein